ncbi:hypothetical protein F5J12DRAFT_860491 [Pisolithus orientalis]|uniref:uncharacterized protein n=1 Tax=Pisolithus orientalis TaxID=936130 RepID=UPI002224F418|nr:uncharacterized protein F5J12DRAFT_860491 [Pisolithus orientalis]KAI5992309.1 hypothetical protein F5J12DRAFT_860491 [Pisolithus orientalis]
MSNSEPLQLTLPIDQSTKVGRLIPKRCSVTRCPPRERSIYMWSCILGISHGSPCDRTIQGLLRRATILLTPAELRFRSPAPYQCRSFLTNGQVWSSMLLCFRVSIVFDLVWRRCLVPDEVDYRTSQRVKETQVRRSLQNSGTYLSSIFRCEFTRALSMKNGPTEDSPTGSFWERGAERGPGDLQSVHIIPCLLHFGFRVPLPHLEPPHQPRIFSCLGIFLQLFGYFLLAVPELLELRIGGFTGSCLVQFPSCINQLFLHQMRFFSFEACDNLLRGFRGFVELFRDEPHSQSAASDVCS